MARLNYHHLLYFWTVVRQGSIARAADELNVTQPTISVQLRTLEDAMGIKLFQKRGGRLIPTETGRTVFEYAQEIFSLGRQLEDVLQGGTPDRPIRFAVGIVEVVSKVVAFEILRPVLQLEQQFELLCREDYAHRLLSLLAVHELDLVITDTPVRASTAVRAFNHLLGESGVSIFGAPRLAAAHRRRFPQSLDGAPFLFPVEETEMWRMLHHFFDASGVAPRRVGEFEDSSLIGVFAQEGLGLFAGSTAVERQIMRSYDVQVVGRLPEARERFYAVSAERKLRHPAVIAITEAARGRLFSAG